MLKWYTILIDTAKRAKIHSSVRQSKTTFTRYLPSYTEIPLTLTTSCSNCTQPPCYNRQIPIFHCMSFPPLYYFEIFVIFFKFIRCNLLLYRIDHWLCFFVFITTLIFIAIIVKCMRCSHPIGNFVFLLRRTLAGPVLDRSNLPPCVLGVPSHIAKFIKNKKFKHLPYSGRIYHTAPCRICLCPFFRASPFFGLSWRR